MLNINTKEIEQRIGNGVKVELQEVNKNNGTVRHGITIKEEGFNCAPIIYIDDMPEEDIIDNVVRIYENCRIDANKVHEEVRTIFDSKDAVLSRVIPIVVNRETNAEFLDSVIHKPLLDLEIIYKVSVTNGTATITNALAKQMDISIEELHESAINNLKNTLKIKNFLEFMPIEAETTKAMWLISNEDMYYGASFLADTEQIISAMDERTGMESDIYIIPSSVHELIAISANNMAEVSDLKFVKDLICFVNTNELDKEDFLSNNLYVIEHDTKEVKIVEVVD